jgi:hypothetical protein
LGNYSLATLRFSPRMAAFLMLWALSYRLIEEFDASFRMN